MFHTPESSYVITAQVQHSQMRRVRAQSFAQGNTTCFCYSTVLQTTKKRKYICSLNLKKEIQSLRFWCCNMKESPNILSCRKSSIFDWFDSVIAEYFKLEIIKKLFMIVKSLLSYVCFFVSWGSCSKKYAFKNNGLNSVVHCYWWCVKNHIFRVSIIHKWET